MRKPSGSQSVEEACAKIAGVDIFNNRVAQQMFFKVAIDYSRNELRHDGIDLLAVASHDELYRFCGLWLEQHPGVSTDMGLIALSLAIRTNAHAIVQSKLTE